MPTLNSVSFAGHLTQDPEIKFLPDSTPIANFTLYEKENRKDKEAVFHNFNFFVFGPQAQWLCENAKKGDMVLAKGKLVQDKWEKEGEKRSTVKIKCEFVRAYVPKDDDIPY